MAAAFHDETVAINLKEMVRGRRSRGMHGTFNGLPLNNIMALKTTRPTAGVTHTTLRMLAAPMPELENRLRLNSPYAYGFAPNAVANTAS